MKNNKGQTLAIFVVFLPILIILIYGIYELGNIYYEKNNLNNINVMAIKYGLDNIDDTDINNKIKNLISINDKDIVIKNIDIKKNNIEIKLEKKIDMTLSKIIGKKNIILKSYYRGNDKRIIKG